MDLFYSATDLPDLFILADISPKMRRRNLACYQRHSGCCTSHDGAESEDPKRDDSVTNVEQRRFIVIVHGMNIEHD